MAPMTTLTERSASLEADTHADRSTISVPALRILGQLAEQHFVAAVAALEEHFAGYGELRAIEETLAGLETEAPARPKCSTAHSAQEGSREHESKISDVYLVGVSVVGAQRWRPNTQE